MRLHLLLILLLLSLSGCASFKGAGGRLTAKLSAMAAANEAIIADPKSKAVIEETSTALDVFCGGDGAGQLAIADLLRERIAKIKNEKSRLRFAVVMLILDEAGANITPADYVQWGNVACNIREGLKAALALHQQP